jgi:hypothetical protein
MHRSLPAFFFVPIILCLTGCAFFRSKPPKTPPRPVFEGRTATLNLTNGIPVVASLDLPHGFIPSAAIPPMWLAQGLTIGVAGTLDQKAVVLGFGGDKLANMTTIATDFGAGAPGGRILCVAASRDGMELATAVAASHAHQLDIFVIDSISGGIGHSVASFDGDYRVSSLNWLDRTTIAIVIQSSGLADDETNPDNHASGLYVIGISGIGSIMHFDQVHCGLRHLSFSPDLAVAVSEGDRDVAPAVVDLRGQSCFEIREPGPIKVLGWSPDFSAILYVAGDQGGTNASVFRFTLATGQRTLVALSSSAAAYASDGTIVAMGNSQLSRKRVERDPSGLAKVEIALINPRTAEIKINSLGFETPLAALARSTMVFTTASDDAAIDTFLSAPEGLLRELIEYSYPSRSAFVIASGDATGPLTTSWSANGRALAMVDGDASHAMLTVLIPPQ